MVAVESGLKADEWVIVSGVLKARPKSPVDAERAPMPTDEAPAAPKTCATGRWAACAFLIPPRT